MLVRPQLEYASEVWSPYTMKCIKKIEQIQRNSCRFISHEYRRDTDTSLLINRLNLYSLYTRKLIQQATMSTKFITTLLTYVLHLIYNMQDISQAELITPWSIATWTPYRLMLINVRFSLAVWIFGIASPAQLFHIRIIQPLYRAALISNEGDVFLMCFFPSSHPRH